MKKVLAFLLVLGLANLASAALVSLVPTAETAADNGDGTFTALADVVVVEVITDTPLLSLDAVVSGGPILGAANLTGDPGFSQNPAIGDNDALLIVGDFNGVEGALASVDVNAPITLEIANDVSAGGSLVLADFSTPDFGGPITIVPEPMTLSLLGLGGLALVRRRRA